MKRAVFPETRRSAPAGGGQAADVADGLLRVVVERGAVERRGREGDVRSGAGERRHLGHVRYGGDLAAPGRRAAASFIAPVAVSETPSVTSRPWWSSMYSLVVVGLLPGRHRLGAGPGEVGADQRGGESEQHRRVPTATSTGRRITQRASRSQRSDDSDTVGPAADRQGVDPRAEHREHRRHDEAAPSQRREHPDRGPGHPDRVQEPLRHQHQRGHRTGNSQAGEQRRPAGGRDRPPMRLPRRSVRAPPPRGSARPSAGRSRRPARDSVRSRC